jgi:lambda family phage minor tail protein L
MSDQSVTQTLISLNPDAYVSLFELYVGGDVGVARFHNGKNFEKSIFFRSYEFFPLPIEHSGFEFSSDGKQNRPTLRVANIDGIITDHIKNRQDLVGAKVKRIKIFVKDLDDKNFPDDINPFYNFTKRGLADGTFANPFTSETYIINRKTLENKYLIEFELSSPLDVENQYLPNRKILDNVCSWKYRGFGCNYGCAKKYANQTINVNNKAKTAKATGQLEPGEAEVEGLKPLNTNIGLPVADDNDKEFWSKDGYYLVHARHKGAYSETRTYSRGDFVFFGDSIDFDFLGEDIQAKQNGISAELYVCIKNDTLGKDPRLNKENWVKDSCSKTLKGCELRWGQYEGGLPYGGFPGTKPFEFVV